MLITISPEPRSPSSESAVIEAWRDLVDHLYTPQDPVNDPNISRWTERQTELLMNMLYEMAESLDYHFDKVTLKKNAYYPTGWNMVEAENTKLRQAAIKIFESERALKVELTNAAEPPQNRSS